MPDDAQTPPPLILAPFMGCRHSYEAIKPFGTSCLPSFPPSVHAAVPTGFMLLPGPVGEGRRRKGPGAFRRLRRALLPLPCQALSLSARWINLEPDRGAATARARPAGQSHRRCRIAALMRHHGNITGESRGIAPASHVGRRTQRRWRRWRVLASPECRRDAPLETRLQRARDQIGPSG